MAPCTRELRGEKFRRGGKTGTTRKPEMIREIILYILSRDDHSTTRVLSTLFSERSRTRLLRLCCASTYT